MQAALCNGEGISPLLHPGPLSPHWFTPFYTPGPSLSLLQSHVCFCFGLKVPVSLKSALFAVKRGLQDKKPSVGDIVLDLGNVL